MKLSRRLLIPIVLVAYFVMLASGVVYYSMMLRQVDDIQTGLLQATLVSLEEEMEITSSVNDTVMARVDVKNLALCRALAELIRLNPDTSMTYDGMQALADLLEVDEVHVINGDGILVAGNVPDYYGMDFRLSDQTAFFLPLLQTPTLELAQEPRLNARGIWSQYYATQRTDDTGFVQVGIRYSVSTLLLQTFTDGLNTRVSPVGETGFVVILHDGIVAAHPDEALLETDVRETEWYAAIKEASDQQIQWLTLSGEEYLAGHSHLGETTLLALLPRAEYYSPLIYMRRFTGMLVAVGGLLIIFMLYYSVKRNIILPLLTISNGVNKVARGNLNVHIEGKYTGEMEQLRRDVNETIQQLKNRQDQVVRNFPGVIWSCDNNLECTLLAGQSMEALGFREEDFLGKNILEAERRHGDIEVAALMEQTLAEGQPQRLNLERMGRYLAFTTSLMYNEQGDVAGLVGVCADVTDLQELQQQLMDTTAEAERASQAKSEFLSRMSHEIRTPMNAIIGMTTIAQKSGEAAKVQYCLDKIGAASNQLLTLINDILDMSKIEANKFELSPTEFDFERMLQNVCNVIEGRAAEKKQNFIVDFTEAFSRNVVADEMRISQVLINLLTNAVKFTPEHGRVTLKIRCHDVDKSFGRISFDVIDTGIGIPPGQQKRLFASFEQADGSITRRYGGTGLGLSICKSLVQMMGGDIEVESTPGQGARFSFAINVQWGNEKGTKDLIRRLPLDNSRILVIDDSEDVCLYFENILQSYGLACDTAQGGQQGIRLAAASVAAQQPYSLIFIDWMMPGMNGIETARHIKTMVSKETIVIMISVADWSEIEREAIRIRVDKFLPKPVLPTVLFESIVGWLNTAAAERVSAEATRERLFTGKTMLLAEDIDINREIIVGMLEDTGLAIDCAVDGTAAVEKYLARPDGYDAILMDIQMPRLDGYQATRKIRESGLPGCESLPIIAMTANAFKSDVEKCLAAGMNNHIAKPVDIDELVAKLHLAFRL